MGKYEIKKTSDLDTFRTVNWPQIPDHRYRILIIGDSGSGKSSSLFNLIIQQPDIDKIYVYTKNLYEAKYQFF